MTFEFLSIFHDFPGKFIFPGFSMIFHDRGNPVQCALQSTKNSAPGSDQICYKLLKHLPDDSLRVLVRLINRVWATGALPTSGVIPLLSPYINPLSQLTCHRHTYPSLLPVQSVNSWRK